MVILEGQETEEVALFTTFSVQGTQCAMDAISIQEVIQLGPLTRVRNAAPEVAGLVNLRGKTVTILDVGLKLGYQKAQPTSSSQVLVIEDHGEFIGLLVDKVGEVVEARKENFQPLPSNTPPEQAQYLCRVCRLQGTAYAQLNIEKILQVNDSL